jgi:hypothetical protein
MPKITPPTGRIAKPRKYVPKLAKRPTLGSELGKNSGPKISADAML